MSGPIQQAIDAMDNAQRTFREHGLVTAEACQICSRIIKGGSHTSDCPFNTLEQAARRLREFQREVQS